MRKGDNRHSAVPGSALTPGLPVCIQGCQVKRLRFALSHHRRTGLPPPASPAPRSGSGQRRSTRCWQGEERESRAMSPLGCVKRATGRVRTPADLGWAKTTAACGQTEKPFIEEILWLQTNRDELAGDEEGLGLASLFGCRQETASSQHCAAKRSHSPSGRSSLGRATSARGTSSHVNARSGRMENPTS